MNTHYDPQFIEDRKQQLVDLRYQTVSELERIARFDAETNSYVPLQPDFDSGSPEDGIDNSNESEVYQNRSGMVESLTKTLSEVDLALSKIEESTYGRCEVTGDWIGEDRLAAYPAARTCSDDHTA